MRFSITIATTVSLLTTHQAIARRHASSMTAWSEEIRVSIYRKIEQEGLTADQTSGLMQQEMTVSAKQRYHRPYGC